MVNISLKNYDGKRRHIPLDVRRVNVKTVMKIVDDVVKKICKGKTYLHCHAGINRTPVISALVLMRLGVFDDFDSALEYIKRRRPCVEPGKKLTEFVKNEVLPIYFKR